MKREFVGTWMTINPVTINPTTTLPEAHEMMRKYEIRRLPVVNSKREIVGIITLTDVRGAEASPATTFSILDLNDIMKRMVVREFMTKNPITVSKDTPIGQAAHLMLEHKIGALPVIDKNEVIGILTESDIFEMVVLHEWEEMALPDDKSSVSPPM